MMSIVYKNEFKNGEINSILQKKLIDSSSFIKRLLGIMCLLLFVSNIFAGSKTIEKTVTVTVGNSFNILPWNEAKNANSSLDIYTCYYTSCEVDNTNAFSVNETKRTITEYKTSTSISATTQKGFYCEYNVKTLAVGTYQITAKANAIRTTFEVMTESTTIIYHVIVEPVKVVTSITIPSDLTLKIGESYTYSPVIYETGAKTTLTWTSSNSSVVSVNNGTIKALSAGTATITCTASNGVSAKCVVTVNPIWVNEISLNNIKCQMEKLAKVQLSATILPSNATNKTLTWSSTDESIAIVDNNGLVTALSTGTCFIKATANDGSGKSAMCEIEVLKDNKLDIKDISICKGGYDALHVYINNEDVIAGFQFDLELPTGITVQESGNGTLSTQIADFASGHSVSANKVGDGLYRFVVVSLTGKTIAPHNNEIMTIDIKASDDVTEGTFEVKIKNMGLTVKDGNDFIELHPLDKKASLTVAPVIPGDVNGDSNISVTDVISIISYVLEERPNKFLTPAADMNTDGNITVTDAVSVIDNILGK